MFNTNLKIADFIRLEAFANILLKKCGSYGIFCLGDVTLVINGLNFS